MDPGRRVRNSVQERFYRKDTGIVQQPQFFQRRQIMPVSFDDGPGWRPIAKDSFSRQRLQNLCGLFHIVPKFRAGLLIGQLVPVAMGSDFVASFGDRPDHVGIRLADLPQNKKSGFAARFAATLQQPVHISPKIGLSPPVSGQVHALIIGMVPVLDVKSEKVLAGGIRSGLIHSASAPGWRTRCRTDPSGCSGQRPASRPAADDIASGSRPSENPAA